LTDKEYERLLTCNECPKKKLGFCKECGCFIKAKIKVDWEECPDEKW